MEQPFLFLRIAFFLITFLSLAFTADAEAPVKRDTVNREVESSKKENIRRSNEENARRTQDLKKQIDRDLQKVRDSKNNPPDAKQNRGVKTKTEGGQEKLENFSRLKPSLKDQKSGKEDGLENPKGNRTKFEQQQTDQKKTTNKETAKADKQKIEEDKTEKDTIDDKARAEKLKNDGTVKADKEKTERGNLSKKGGELEKWNRIDVVYTREEGRSTDPKSKLEAWNEKASTNANRNRDVVSSRDKIETWEHPKSEYPRGSIDEQKFVDSRTLNDPSAKQQKNGVSEIQKQVNTSEIKPGMELNPSEFKIFRGGKDFIVKNHEVKVDATSGFVQPGRGVSLDINAASIEKFGGAHQIKSLPPELTIIQRGDRLEHFEIAPRQPMSREKFQELLHQIQLY